ncbi:MAG: sulfotransferase domain-containing protein [Alphaproteobacteria bacterium]|nr:sulfotransferase domain-containing protein [Alphaproteobacteria bacterium]
MNRAIPDTLHGLWSVENADRGEHLDGADQRIITGGTVMIDSISGHVAASFETRGGDGRTPRLRTAGRIATGPEGAFIVDMGVDTRMVLQRLDDGRLRRIDYSGHTREEDLTLAPTSTEIDPAVARTTLLPPILFNTMPKSGSIFISRSLARALGIGETKIAVSLFPDDLVLRDRLDTLALGNLISQQHLPAREPNLRFLANRLDRMIVHVRDPRQATLSWLHHLDNFHAHRELEPACRLGLEAVSPALPADYFERDFAEKLDHLLSSHYAQLIEWTQNWVAAENTVPGLDIRITTFEEFVADPRGFMAEVLAFFEIPETAFDDTNLPRREAQTHFRVGRTDEWLEVFSEDQKARANTLLPKDLCTRFAWRVT